MGTRNPKGVISASLASWVEIRYLMRGEREFRRSTPSTLAHNLLPSPPPLTISSSLPILVILFLQKRPTMNRKYP
ncbi:hypothetical protein EVAR_55857_1 [Eumeta japonica]|uniref:Uncharacterized protein n=1 Tax=Eumeta variegata TaxID=151549 RepID=A0A4C1Z6C6_EUMVA|nr:hypothetical protein EVAR_55857_1 [Eumeta japonica]